MNSRFEELMAREDFVVKEGWTTAEEISDLSGNPASYEERLLNKLAETGRIGRADLYFPREQSDGFGDENKITYFMCSDLFRKIRQEERKPESPVIEAYNHESPKQIQHYTGRCITSVRWKLFVNGKEGFKIPGVIKC